MMHGTYNGIHAFLMGKTALLMDRSAGSKPDSGPDQYFAQFDDRSLTLDGVPLGFGWHEFPADDWILDEPVDWS